MELGRTCAGGGPGWYPVRTEVVMPFAVAFHCLVVCPGCGKTMSLARRVHQVAADGTVSPSLVCPFPPCGFHQFVRLEGWDRLSGAG